MQILDILKVNIQFELAGKVMGHTLGNVDEREKPLRP